MDTKREQIADLLLTAAVIGVWLRVGDPVIATFLGGVAVEWAADQTWKIWEHVRQRFLGESGLLNNRDLQQALARAFRHAIAQLEEGWWQTHRGSQMRRSEPEAAAIAREVFKMLRDDAERFCTPSHLTRAAEHEQVRQLLYGDRVAVRYNFSERLADYLHGHDPQLVAFIKARLVQELTLCFGEELLKAEHPENNRAWRAFQRLLLEGLKTELEEMRVEQQVVSHAFAELQAELRAWAERMDGRPPEEREDTGKAALEQALADTRDQLLEAIERESILTRLAIEELRAEVTKLQQAVTTRDIGSVIIRNIFVIGDHNRVFVGSYELLRDAYIKPWSVFEHLDQFVGRDWLTARVDAFVRDNDRGYIILEAEAGLGKTTFLAHLVRERGYIHHFVELAPGLDGVAAGLRNLAAQLIRAWELNQYSVGEVLPAAAIRPDFLQNLLFEAARQRDEIRPREKIVLVVDALDEAGVLPGLNVLGLPKVLPEGVYIIASQRPVEIPLTVEGPRRVSRLQATSEQNLADMRIYLERAVRWEGVAQALQENGYSMQQFVEAFLEKCQGVWIYLHYMVGEIERGERSPLDLDTLPKGMWQYYAQYWQRWRSENPEEWDDVHLPLLSMLAAVQEDISLGILCTLANVVERPALRRLLEEAWRPFLMVVEGAEPRYRFHHTSLQEFLDGRADLTDMTAAEHSLTRELAEATRRAHVRIAERYLVAWGGLEAALPELQDPAKRDMDGRYGLRHLAAHLEGARRVDDVHKLLRVEWHHQEEELSSSPGWRGLFDRLLGRRVVLTRTYYSENTWHVAHEQVNDASGYLSDVARAWRLAEEVSHGEIQRAKPAASVGLEVRYALITASFNSLARNITSAILVVAVEKKVLTPAEGLAYARQMPDPEQRGEAVAGLAPHLPEALLWEALAATQSIKYDKCRAETLIGLAPHLPESLLWKALATAQTIKDTEARARALMGLAPHLPKALLQEVLVAARAIRPTDVRARVLSGVASQMSEPMKGEVFREALATARTIEWKWERAQVLTDLVPHLSEPLKREVLQEALETAQAIESEWEQARVLVDLAPHLPATLLQEVLAVARSTWDTRARAKALAGLAPHLSEPSKGEVLQEALGTAQAIEWEWERVEVLIRLAAHSPEALMRQVLAAVLAMEDETRRAEALGELAPYLPEPLEGEVLQEALETAQAIESEWEQARVLADLAPHLPAALLQEALAVARSILGTRARAKALAGLAPHLSEPLRGRVLWQALTLVQLQLPQDDVWRAEVMEKLAPYLPEPLVREVIAALGIRDARRRMWTHKYARLGLGDPALAIRDVGAWMWTLSGLAPYLPQALLLEVLGTARAIPHANTRARILVSLTPHLPEPAKGEAVQEALDAARALWCRRERERAEVLVELAPHLPEALLWKALAMVRVADNNAAQAQTAAGLAQDERDEKLQQWIDAGAQARVLIGLAPHLSGALLQEAVAAARTIEAVNSRAQALVGLVPHLPAPVKGEVVQEALDVAWAISENNWQNKRRRAKALADLVPHLPEQLRREVLQEALTTVRSIEDTGFRAMVLADVMPNLPESLRREALREELRTIMWTVDKRWHVEALVKLAPHLSAVLLQEVLDSVSNLRYSGRARVLASLAPHLPEETKGEILREALVETRVGISESDERAQVLTELAPHLPEPLKEEALKEALAVAREEDVNSHRRTQLLAGVAPHLTELPLASLYSIWRETLPILATHTRQELLMDLRALIPVIATLGGTEAVTETFHAIRDAGRWWSLLYRLE